jgi:D-citramalate synthase
MKNPELHVEILDTTLRDGEQTPGVAFTPKEKLDIARMLRRLKADRVEIGSARVSEGEAEGIKKIIDWSWSHDNPEKLEILGFVDGGRSVEWIRNTGAKAVNLLCKGYCLACAKNVVTSIVALRQAILNANISIVVLANSTLFKEFGVIGRSFG